MDYFRNLLLFFLTEKCFDEYFLKFNFFDIPCFRSSLSRILGAGIILGSITVKVPQILKILKSKSGKGINVYGVNLELFAITSTISYSFIKQFPFSAWGDGIFLAIQTSAISVLVIFFSGNKSGAFTYIIGYIGLLLILMSGITPISFLWALQACNIPVIFVGKMVQAYTNYKNGSTGQLSAITCFLLLAGSTARIFTSIQETGDFIMILSFIIASVSNLVIVLQLLWYWNVDKPIIKSAKHTKKD